jgi:hypothetical protein
VPTLWRPAVRHRASVAVAGLWDGALVKHHLALYAPGSALTELEMAQDDEERYGPMSQRRFTAGRGLPPPPKTAAELELETKRIELEAAKAKAAMTGGCGLIVMGIIGVPILGLLVLLALAAISH